MYQILNAALIFFWFFFFTTLNSLKHRQLKNFSLLISNLSLKLGIVELNPSLIWNRGCVIFQLIYIELWRINSKQNTRRKKKYAASSDKYRNQKKKGIRHIKKISLIIVKQNSLNCISLLFFRTHIHINEIIKLIACSR
jgi:hypothetical protein